MEKNDLIPVKESIFVRIKNRFLNMFGKSDSSEKTASDLKNEQTNYSRADRKESFKAGIVVEGINEKQRLLDLKRKYDNDEISEKDMSHEDMQALTRLYKEETEEIHQDVEKRRKNITRLLNLKKKNVYQG